MTFRRQRRGRWTSMHDRGTGQIGMMIAIAVVASLVAVIVVVQGVVTGAASMFARFGANEACGDGAPRDGSQLARGDIPRPYYELYKKAGYGVPWHILAAIGKVETDHGRLRAKGVRSGQNFAGAKGPMQFLQGTWDAYGVDGNRDGRKDIYDPRDAIPAAARYLRASGAPVNMYRAIFAYNHADWYVRKVLDWSQRYVRGGATVGRELARPCVEDVTGQVPAGLVGRIIARALSQVGKPYIWGGTGPGGFDCSGLVYDAFRSVGVRIPRTTFHLYPMGPHVPRGSEQPGDFVFFSSGPNNAPGRPGHMGLVIGKGMMVVAPRTGKLIEVTSYTDRRNLVGFTRPLAHPSVRAQLKRAA